MMDVENCIYEDLSSSRPISCNGGNGFGMGLQRQKSATTLNGFSNYAVPRRVNSASPQRTSTNGTTPPLYRANPPSLPPRNRFCSDGDREMTLSASLDSSPSDRGFFSPGRVRTPTYTNLTKSPSIQSVGSAHSYTPEELSLSEFMTKYSKSLPHRVKVGKGFFGVSEQTAVTTGDLLNLHFIKPTKVVVVKTVDREDSTTYSFPISSSIKFSPLYDPNDNIDEARKGYRFETVGEMMTKKTLPKLVRATRAHKTNSPDTSVLENELLIIKSTRSKITGKQQLKVYSLTAQKRKTLSENCAGRFTTAPSQLKLHLYEIAIHMAEFFPHKAILSVQESMDCVLNDLQGMVVIVKKAITETSVIATSHLDEPECGEQREVSEIPIDLDIEVESVALDENELEQLKQDTCELYETFDPFSVNLFITKSSKRQYDIQNELYKTLITGGGDYKGLDIVRPATIASQLSNRHLNSAGSSIYQSLSSTTNSTSTDYYVLMNPRDIATTQESYETSDQSGDSAISERDHLSLLESHLRHIEKKLFEEVGRLTSRMDHLSRRYDSMQTQIRMLHMERSNSLGSVASTSPPTPSVMPPTIAVDNRPPAPLPAEAQLDLEADRTYHIVQDNKTVEYSLGTSDGSKSSEPSESGSVRGTTPQPDVQDSNKEYLSTLNHQEVLQLLDAMKLKSYRDSFKKEQVNGEILSECDDDVLTNDLGVTSKLHRIKLMKVISGRHSAKNILSGEDPYANRK